MVRCPRCSGGGRIAHKPSIRFGSLAHASVEIIECPTCSGAGELEVVDMVECYFCCGRGKVACPTMAPPATWYECPTCSGAGELEAVACPHCHGKGQMTDPPGVNSWGHTCKCCKGEGKVAKGTPKRDYDTYYYA